MRINKVLVKYKLLEVFETELNIEKKTFIKQFKDITEKGYYTPFLIMFDYKNSGDKKYIGNVDSNSFKIREKFNLGNSSPNNFAIAKSEFHTENNTLKIKTKIQGMEIIPLIFRVVLFCVYILSMAIAMVEILSMLFSSDTNHIDSRMIFGLMVLSFFTFLLTIYSYMIAKKHTEEMKKSIERIYMHIQKTPYNKT